MNVGLSVMTLNNFVRAVSTGDVKHPFLVCESDLLAGPPDWRLYGIKGSDLVSVVALPESLPRRWGKVDSALRDIMRKAEPMFSLAVFANEDLLAQALTGLTGPISAF